ncbi:MAG: hypothetical protein AB4911_08930 [Oscillochloridaceae bacterium umkhey_bin13]
MAFDTADPYHYVRTQAAKEYDVLIVGGEDHKTGQADDAELYAPGRATGRGIGEVVGEGLNVLAQ